LEPTTCVTGSFVNPYGALFWATQGRYFSVTENGIPNEQLLAIARSLDR
jgi:hypothetical protein